MSRGDPGGLNYNIDLGGNILAQVSALRASLDAVDAQFQAVAASAALAKGEAAQATKNLAQSLASLNAAVASAKAPATPPASSGAPRGDIFNREAVRASTSALLENVKAKNAADAAERKLNNTEFVAAQVRRKIAEARLRDIIKLKTDLAAKSGGGGGSFLKSILGFGDHDENRLTRIADSLRRLVGVVLVLKGIRLAFQGVDTLVRSLIGVNAELEQVQLGIAAVISAAGTVRDATGQAVTGSRALALSQAEAARQTNLLRVDALQTVASFKDLAEAFEQAIGPGLEAGLDLSQIRRFTLNISQAASALGLESRQLSEEIRSILSGTINARNTRIATALGITNEDIKRARELGTLADLLQTKFAAFNAAGQESQKTFAGLVSNIKDALQAVVALGGTELFGNAKKQLQDVLNTLVKINPQTGLLEPTPEALAGVRAIADGVDRAVTEAGKFFKSLGIVDAVQAAKLFGDFIAIAAKTVRGLLTGVVQGFGDIKTILETLSVGLKLFGDGDLASAIALLTRIFVLISAIRIVAGPLVPMVGALVVGLAKISGLLKIIGVAMVTPITSLKSLKDVFTTAAASTRAWIVALAPAAAPFIIVAAKVALVLVALAAVAEVTRRIVNAATGMELTWSKIGRIVSVVILEGIKQLGREISLVGSLLKVAFLNTFDLISIAWKSTIGFLVSFFANRISEIIGAAARVSSAFGFDDIAAQADAAAAAIKQMGDEFERMKKEEAAAASARIDSRLDSLQQEAQNVQGQGAATAGRIARQVSGIISDKDTAVDPKQLEQAVAQGKLLVDAVQELPGIIGSANSRLFDTADLFKQIAQDIREVETASRGSGISVSGPSEAAQRVVTQASIEASKELLSIDREKLRLEAALAESQAASMRVKQRFVQLSIEEGVQVSRSINAAQVYQSAQAETARATSTLQNAQIELNRVRQSGDIAAIKNAKEELESAQELLTLTIRREEQAKAAEGLSTPFIGASPERARELQDLTIETLRTSGLQVAREDEINTLLSRRAVVEARINTLRDLRLVQTLREASLESSLQSRLRGTRAATSGRLANVAGAASPVREVAEAQASLQIKQQEIQIERRRRDAAISRLSILQDTLRIELQGLSTSLLSAKSEEDRATLQEALVAKSKALVASEESLANSRAENTDLVRQEAAELQTLSTRAIKAKRDLQDLIAEQLQRLEIQRAQNRAEEGVAAADTRSAVAASNAFRQRASAQDFSQAIAEIGTIRAQINLDRVRQETTLLDLQRKFSNLSRDLSTSRVRQIANLLQGVSPAQQQDDTADVVNKTNELKGLQEEINHQKRLGILLDERSNALLDEAVKAADEKRIKEQGSLDEQVRLAAETLDRELPSRFDIILRDMSAAVEGFSSFFADSVVDAFDPTKQTSIRERFGAFLQDLSRQILSMFFRIAITKAALGLTGIFGFNAGGQVPQSFRHGGQVRDDRRHGHRRGYQGGGEVGGGAQIPVSSVPPGVDRRDRVPALLSPREWVHPVDSVVAYGRDFMSAVQHRLIDPAAARGLLQSSTSYRRQATRAGRGFNTGGSPSGSSLSSMPGATSTRGGGVQQAVVVANDAEMEKLTSGGETAMLRFLSKHGFQPNT